MFRHIRHLESDLRFELQLGQQDTRNRAATNRFTVVIGPNGSGKSRLLRSIADQFSGPTDEEIRWAPSSDPTASVRDRPSRVLVMTNMVTDAFAYRGKGSGYRYLGLRQNTNFASTGSLSQTTALSIAQCLIDPDRSEMLIPVFDLLKVHQASVTFLRPNRSAESERQTEKAREILRQRRLPVRREFDFEADGELLIRRLAEFSATLPSRKGVSRLDTYLDERNSLQELGSISHQFEMDLGELMVFARRAGFAEWEVTFRTPNRFRTLAEMSAGQLLLLSLISRLAAHVHPESLVLIDEPETGLHPTWQSEFVPLLQRTMPSKHGCHFFIATHSPHVVADGTDVLVPGPQWGSFEAFDEPFYGRSVENLLYRVFGARVTGNQEVDNDLLTLMQFVSRAVGERNEVVLAYQRLRKIAGPDTQLVNTVLDRAASSMDDRA